MENHPSVLSYLEEMKHPLYVSKPPIITSFCPIAELRKKLRFTEEEFLGVRRRAEGHRRDHVEWQEDMMQKICQVGIQTTTNANYAANTAENQAATTPQAQRM